MAIHQNDFKWGEKLLKLDQIELKEIPPKQHK